jgi:hypothetical protein
MVFCLETNTFKKCLATASYSNLESGRRCRDANPTTYTATVDWSRDCRYASLVACNNCFASASESRKDISRECENAVPRGCAPLRTLRAKPRSGESLLAQCVSAGLEHPLSCSPEGAEVRGICRTFGARSHIHRHPALTHWARRLSSLRGFRSADRSASPAERQPLSRSVPYAARTSEIIVTGH